LSYVQYTTEKVTLYSGEMCNSVTMFVTQALRNMRGRLDDDVTGEVNY